MGSVAFSWNSRHHYRLLLVHNRDDYHGRMRMVKPACWDENQQVFGGRDEETGGYSLSFSKNERIAFLVHPNGLARTPGIECLVSDFTSSKESILPADFAERCRQRETLGNNFYLIVADINSRSMYYIKQTTDTPLQYRQVTPGAYILSDCGLDATRPNDPTSPKSAALMVKFENMLIMYDNREPCGQTIAETIMSDPTRADEEDFLSSAFVVSEGYGTLCTSSISVMSYNPHLNAWDLTFSENYKEENGQWLKQNHFSRIANDYIPTWQRTGEEGAQKEIVEEQNRKKAVEAATEAAQSAASDGKTFCTIQLDVGLDAAAVREAVSLVMDKKEMSVMVFSTDKTTNKSIACAGVPDKGDQFKQLDVTEWLTTALSPVKGICRKVEDGLALGEGSDASQVNAALQLAETFASSKLSC